MTEQTGKSVEAQNLAEHITLLREAFENLRREITDGLQQRVTHAELNGFHELYRTKLEHIAEQVDTVARHAETARGNLQNDLDETKRRLDETKRHLNDEQSMRKKVVYTGIAAVAATVIGTTFLYILGIN